MPGRGYSVKEGVEPTVVAKTALRGGTLCDSHGWSWVQDSPRWEVALILPPGVPGLFLREPLTASSLRAVLATLLFPRPI